MLKLKLAFWRVAFACDGSFTVCQKIPESHMDSDELPELPRSASTSSTSSNSKNVVQAVERGVEKLNLAMRSQQTTMNE